MGRLNGKVAIVTGANLTEGGVGIGGATALLMAREGAKVVVADIVDEPAAKLVAKIKRENGEAVACHVDIRSEEQIKAMVETAIGEFGGLDILHNNASVLPGEEMGLKKPFDADVLNMDAAVWDMFMEVNVRGTMLCCKHAIPQMIKRGGGAIVNTASAEGLTGMPIHTAYGVSKGGIIVLTQYIATQYGKQGVRCNAICPGATQTATFKSLIQPEMLEILLKHTLTPRIGLPEDIANAVVFLASEDAAFITGHIMSVDGGLLAHQPFTSDLLQLGARTGT